ncbi:MAG TPA: 2-C-methyl-D-erythritol 4-phosphate cytidylyltransferase [Flavipsychrobacter sp.]|nr:2-C-methyl-D-erythritol 4-phosphate cytidylyltransferase [Flavipsychrobacter sp.]
MQTPPIYAVIVAGGQGTRMGTAVPKQFLELNGHPVLYHTIRAFQKAIEDVQIILVLPEHHISYAQMVLQSFSERIDITIVAGGETRFHSVKKGLQGIPDNSIIMVHDGVRPLVSAALIRSCCEQAKEKGSAIPAIAATDSIRILEGAASRQIDRTLVRLVQTPQTFKASILLPVMEQDYQDGFTDEATVAEYSGIPIHLIEGEKRNLKITTQEDLIIAEVWMKTE